MGARLVSTAIALFFTAYAQSSPLFSIFGIRPNVVLAFAVLAGFSFTVAAEYAVLVSASALGFASGIGFPQACIFFALIFMLARVVREMAPLRLFLSGSVLVIVFSFLIYTSLGWDMVARLAPLAAREALCNVAVFAVLYALLPPHYVRKGKY